MDDKCRQRPFLRHMTWLTTEARRWEAGKVRKRYAAGLEMRRHDGASFQTGSGNSSCWLICNGCATAIWRRYESVFLRFRGVGNLPQSIQTKLNSTREVATQSERRNTMPPRRRHSRKPEMIGVAHLFACVHVDKGDHLASLVAGAGHPGSIGDSGRWPIAAGSERSKARGETPRFS